MRVFVTGATGFVGSAVVKELLSAGHTVLGLTRSDTGAHSLAAVGAEVLRGDLEDLNSLRRGAEEAEAVIHTAFLHDWTRFAESCVIDKRAIDAIGEVLQGSRRPLLVTGGLATQAQGRAATENDPPVPVSKAYPRASEEAAGALAAHGVNASVVRLPQVHDTAKQGLVTYLITLARQKGISAYVGQGETLWSAVHVRDAARLYRLALENSEAGARYHAVAEEGVSLREIAEAIGRALKVPVESVSSEQAAAHFGFLARFMELELRGSSAQTRAKLRWNPTGPSLLTDIENMHSTQG